MIPRVTIITPTYNRAHFLPETIESILNQNYPNLQYLVIDDGSTDNTQEVVARYPQVTCIYQENKGEPEAVNVGWRMADGEFACVVNSDDPQPSELIQRSIEVMQANPDVIVTYPDWFSVKGGKRTRMYTAEYDYKRMLLNVECIPGPGAFLRIAPIRAVYQNLRDTRYTMLSDLECWLRVGLIGTFLRIPEPLAFWFEHKQGATQKNRGKAFAELTIEIYRNFLAEKILPESIKPLESRILAAVYIKAMMWSVFGNKTQMPHYFWKALRQAPLYAIQYLFVRGLQEVYQLIRKKCH